MKGGSSSPSVSFAGHLARSLLPKRHTTNLRHANNHSQVPGTPEYDPELAGLSNTAAHANARQESDPESSEHIAGEKGDHNV